MSLLSSLPNPQGLPHLFSLSADGHVLCSYNEKTEMKERKHPHAPTVPFNSYKHQVPDALPSMLLPEMKSPHPSQGQGAPHSIGCHLFSSAPGCLSPSFLLCTWLISISIQIICQILTRKMGRLFFNDTRVITFKMCLQTERLHCIKQPQGMTVIFPKEVIEGQIFSH